MLRAKFQVGGVGVELEGDAVDIITAVKHILSTIDTGGIPIHTSISPPSPNQEVRSTPVPTSTSTRVGENEPERGIDADAVVAAFRELARPAMAPEIYTLC